MTSPKFVFHLTCLLLGIVDRGAESVKTGNNLTCSDGVDAATRIHLYRQPLGQKPQLTTMYYKLELNGTSHGELEDNPRFTLNLTIKNLTISDSATYTCAYSVSYRNGSINVTVEDGTKSDFEYKVDCEVLVYILSGALAFTSLLVVLLACTVITMKKRNSSRLQDSQARFPASSTANDGSSQEADNLHYATVCFNHPDGSGRQRNNTVDECLYSTVRP